MVSPTRLWFINHDFFFPSEIFLWLEGTPHTPPNFFVVIAVGHSSQQIVFLHSTEVRESSLGLSVAVMETILLIYFIFQNFLCSYDSLSNVTDPSPSTLFLEVYEIS
jgi:hypothetical protein